MYFLAHLVRYFSRERLPSTNDKCLLNSALETNSAAEGITASERVDAAERLAKQVR